MMIGLDGQEISDLVDSPAPSFRLEWLMKAVKMILPTTGSGICLGGVGDYAVRVGTPTARLLLEEELTAQSAQAEDDLRALPSAIQIGLLELRTARRAICGPVADWGKSRRWSPRCVPRAPGGTGVDAAFDQAFGGLRAQFNVRIGMCARSRRPDDAYLTARGWVQPTR